MISLEDLMSLLVNFTFLCCYALLFLVHKTYLLLFFRVPYLALAKTFEAIENVSARFVKKISASVVLIKAS